MQLNLFEEVKRKKKQDLSSKFLLLRDNIMLQEQRKILSSWTEGFEDRDNKIVDEFQKNFNSSFWEFYLYAIFNKLGFEIDMTKEMPDFIIKKPFEFYVEAVIPNIKINGRPESERKIEETLGGLYPIHKQDDFEEIIDEAIIRQASAIKSKNEKFTNVYQEKEWVKANAPFVIAEGSFDQVNYWKEFYYPMMALLYDYYYNRKTEGFMKRGVIIKPDTGGEIQLGIFNDKSHEHISAIIFSCTLTLGKLTALAIVQNSVGLHNLNRVLNIRHDMDWPHFKVQEVSADNPEELIDGVFIFHNPNAKNKLPLSVFSDSGAVQVYVENGGIKFDATSLPLVARINTSSFFLGSDPMEIIKEISDNYNGEISFSDIEFLKELLDKEVL